MHSKRIAGQALPCPIRDIPVSVLEKTESLRMRRTTLFVFAWVLAANFAPLWADEADSATPAATQPASQPNAELSDETPEAEQDPDNILTWDRLTGNWFGVRDKFEENGFTFELDYASTLSVNTHGGVNTRHAVEHNVDLNAMLTFDTGKLGLWPGGEFFINGEGRYGPSITERHVGSFSYVHNDEMRDLTQVTEYWYRQRLLDDKLWFKLGKMDSWADFNIVEYGLNFFNTSFGGNPLIPLPTSPETALGAVLGLEPCDWLYALAGVYDGEPDGRAWGFETAFHGRDDSVTLFEIGLRPKLKCCARDLPGAYRVGGFYASAEHEYIRGDLGGRLRPRLHRGNSGLYLAFDQLLWKESDAADDEQGLGAFFQFGWTPEAYNPVDEYYGFGFQWTGLLPGRDDDVTGFAFGHAVWSGPAQALWDLHNETALEWFYKVQLTPWMNLQPDLQYFVDPGGTGRDALVFNLRLQISF